MRKELEHCRRRRVTMALWFFTTCLLIASIPVHAKTKNLLEFNSGSHVLGFSSGSMYMASGTHVLRVEFVGGKSVAPVSKEGLSSDGKAPPLSKVIYPNIWDGVDIVYEGAKGSIVKSTYTVAAGKAPGSIRLRYNRPLTLDKKGNLVVRFETGEMTESRPVAWQVVEGKKKPVMVAYNLQSDKEVGFTVKDYDTSLPLVIDPYFSWNTFLGGSGTDYGYAIAVDSGGNIYVAGASSATWGTSPVRAYTSNYDAFVAKLTADGVLVWNTFVGGDGVDYSQAVTVDSAGNVYVAGISTAAWGAPVRGYTSGYDGFAAKLTPDGALVWNTFLGGKGNDWGSGIAVDLAGNTYVTGYGDGAWGSPIRGYAGGNYDGFAAKLTPDGALVWNTFLGSYFEDHGTAIAADSGGNVYVAGRSVGSWGTPVRDYTAGYDAFVAKLTGNGALIWTTFLGGYDSDWGNAITVDSNDYVYVAGDSYATWGLPKRPYNADLDAFAAKLTPDGALIWNTFLGGKGADRGKGIAVDSSGNAHVTGYSTAAWGAPVRGYASDDDAFVAELGTTDGMLLWSAFLGGSGSDQGWGVAVDSSGGVCVAGYSTAAWGAPVRGYTSGYDAFVARFGYSGTFSLSVATAGTGSGSVTSSPSGIDCGSTCVGSFSLGSSVTLTANANTGSTFRGFTGCDSTSNNTCKVFLTSDRIVTATFTTTGACTYTISPARASFAYKGGSANVTVQATGTNCASPFVYVSDTWIGASLTSFKNNKGTVKVTAPANNSVTERKGEVTIETNTFTITQVGSPCSLTSISPTSKTFTASGGSHSFAVTATTGCGWSVLLNADWLTPFTVTGTGTDSVSYAAPVNTTGKQRSGKITVFLTDTPTKKKVFTAKQSPCTLTISPTADTFISEGGSGLLIVTAPEGCPWSVSSNADWLTTGTGSGSGEVFVSYTALKNTTGKQRSGKITVFLTDTPSKKKACTVTEKK